MKRFVELAVAIGKELKVKDAVLDGDIVALDDPAGQPLRSHEAAQAVYCAFDIIWLNEPTCAICR